MVNKNNLTDFDRQTWTFSFKKRSLPSKFVLKLPVGFFSPNLIIKKVYILNLIPFP